MPLRPPLRGPFRDDPRARAAYAEGAGIYRILPTAVCRPADLDDLRVLARWAAETGTGLVPRGAGSAMGGGNVGRGVIVDLTAFPWHLEIDAPRGRAHASANVTWANLNAAAAESGLRLPPDPSSGRWATLGGMLSTNAAGARSMRYGSVRPWVAAATLVAANGEVVELRRGIPATGTIATTFGATVAPRIERAAAAIRRGFPQVRKNSSGYALDAYLDSGDLLDLIIGAEGTLGFVTDIEWRLDPTPVHRAGLRLWLPSLDLLGDVVTALRPTEPSAVELLDRTFLDLVGVHGHGAEAVVLVEFEAANPESLDTALTLAAAASRSLGVRVETAHSPEDTEALWTLRHAASPILAGLPPHRRSLQVIEDGCVPVERLGEYIRLVRDAAGARGIDLVIFGHAGDGHVHVNLLPDVGRPGWEPSVAALLVEVTEGVIRLGGTPSGEHGDGRLRAGFLDRLYGAEIVDLFRAVKTAFDPLGILNPGIILPAGGTAGAPIADLKVGADAVPLPADIAAALRTIEQCGGYAQCRLELA